MKDRRPSNPELWVSCKHGRRNSHFWNYPPGEGEMCSGGHWASPADLISVVRRGVESGTIKGEEAGVYITRMLQRFNPPADMSINEKVAYKEAIHWAWDFLMSEFGSHLVIPVSDGGSET